MRVGILRLRIRFVSRTECSAQDDTGQKKMPKSEGSVTFLVTTLS